MKVTDIFMVSYSRDIEWFRWSVAIIAKNLTGFRRIIAVAPVQDRHLFDPVAAQHPQLQMRYIPDWPGAGYFWQQWVKINADSYTDADLIAHIDSDVYVKEPVAIEDFFSGGKPGWLWAYYTDVRADDAGVWRAPTERASGLVCEREFMEGFPFILHRSTYAVCRSHLESVHGDHKKYIQTCGKQGGAAFSEFNFMGRVAWEKQHDLYHWVDRNREPWPAGFHRTRQFWSHAKFEDCLPEIRQMLDGGNDHRIRVTNRGIWVLSNDTHISKWVEQENRLDHDVPTLERLCRHIKPGDTVVDVGAFIGDHTIAYARATHGAPGGRVIAFEPNPPAFACLTRNLAGFGHVQCINAGLSDTPGEMAIAADPNAGASHLKSGAGVEVRTLDSMDLDRLDFLKIDAEGMELRILNGAERTIVACQPVLYIEINRGALERAGTSAAAVLGWLEDHGYQLNGVEDGPQFDVLCLPPAKASAVQAVVLVLGVSHREVHLGRLWLRWVSHLCRQSGGDNSKNTLVIFVNRRTTPEQRQQLMAEVGDAKDGMFKTVIAEPHDEQERGYPGSASHLFVRALEYVEQHHPGAATLWCEADTVPVRPSWFREIVDEYRACGLPFMGGQAGLGEFRHMTGNAVYPPDWRTLAPLLLDSYTATDSAYWGEGKGEPWDVFARSQVMPRMHLCRTIQQIWRPARFGGLGQILPATALFHQCKDGSLVRVLAERYPGFTPPTPAFGFTMMNRYTAVEAAGMSFPFTPCEYLTGLGWASALEPTDYYQELELHLLAARQCGIEAVAPAEARKMLAGAARSRLPIPPVNTLRF